ncbi:hypothetical protein ACED34_11775 [Vibrio splendidus]|uniref:hypothetical protein n=1 Tax=Vibrio splendidus TaxID=29497 RepID=UPI00352C9486
MKKLITIAVLFVTSFTATASDFCTEDYIAKQFNTFEQLAAQPTTADSVADTSAMYTAIKQANYCVKYVRPELTKQFNKGFKAAEKNVFKTYNKLASEQIAATEANKVEAARRVYLVPGHLLKAQFPAHAYTVDGNTVTAKYMGITSQVQLTEQNGMWVGERLLSDKERKAAYEQCVDYINAEPLRIEADLILKEATRTMNKQYQMYLSAGWERTEAYSQAKYDAQSLYDMSQEKRNVIINGMKQCKAKWQ